MGKYDEVNRRLTKFEDDDLGHQARVEEVKRTIDDRASGSLARAWKELRGKKSALEEKLSGVELALTAYGQLIENAYEEDGITSLKFKEGGSVALEFVPHATVLDREEFRRWCIEEDLTNSLVLPFQTLNALTKERLLDGQNEPPGVKAFVRTKFVLRSK